MVDFLLHFYRNGDKPFRSLSALPDAKAIQFMSRLYVEGSIFWERFQDPHRYLKARRQVEQWLRTEFIAKGGRPKDSYPIYLVLGRPKWLETVADPATLATTAEIQLPLSLFKEWEVSFTYPDSMVSMLLAAEKNPEYYEAGFHGKLFTLPEIRSLVESRGLPGERWKTNIPPRLANYIEAQVWNHQVLQDYINKIAMSSSSRKSSENQDVRLSS
jgi:hypothetical protein